MLWGALETIEIAGLAMLLGTVIAVFLVVTQHVTFVHDRQARRFRRTR